MLQRVHGWIGDRPMFFSEFYFDSPSDSGLTGGGKDVASQRERGLAYRQYVEQAAALGYVVGIEWFTLVDQATTGRFFEKYSGEVGEHRPDLRHRPPVQADDRGDDQDELRHLPSSSASASRSCLTIHDLPRRRKSDGGAEEQGVTEMAWNPVKPRPESSNYARPPSVVVGGAGPRASRCSSPSPRRCSFDSSSACSPSNPPRGRLKSSIGPCGFPRSPRPSRPSASPGRLGPRVDQLPPRRDPHCLRRRGRHPLHQTPTPVRARTPPDSIRIKR